MPVDIFVMKPERIANFSQLEDILTRITAYEQERKCKGGVLLTQNRQFGGFYRITSEEEAKKSIEKPILSNTCEWGLKFYSHEYFESLKNKFNKSYH